MIIQVYRDQEGSVGGLGRVGLFSDQEDNLCVELGEVGKS